MLSEDVGSAKSTVYKLYIVGTIPKMKIEFFLKNVIVDLWYIISSTIEDFTFNLDISIKYL